MDKVIRTAAKAARTNACVAHASAPQGIADRCRDLSVALMFSMGIAGAPAAALAQEGGKAPANQRVLTTSSVVAAPVAEGTSEVDEDAQFARDMLALANFVEPVTTTETTSDAPSAAVLAARAMVEEAQRILKENERQAAAIAMLQRLQAAGAEADERIAQARAAGAKADAEAAEAMARIKLARAGIEALNGGIEAARMASARFQQVKDAVAASGNKAAPSARRAPVRPSGTAGAAPAQ